MRLSMQSRRLQTLLQNEMNCLSVILWLVMCIEFTFRRYRFQYIWCVRVLCTLALVQVLWKHLCAYCRKRIGYNTSIWISFVHFYSIFLDVESFGSKLSSWNNKRLYQKKPLLFSHNKTWYTTFLDTVFVLQQMILWTCKQRPFFCINIVNV